MKKCKNWGIDNDEDDEDEDDDDMGDFQYLLFILKYFKSTLLWYMTGPKNVMEMMSISIFHFPHFHFHFHSQVI